MYKFVQQLQRKDERQKRALLVLMTAVSALVVGGAWLFTLKNRLSNSEAYVGSSFQVKVKEEHVDRVSVNVERPFTSLKETAVSSFAAIQTQIQDLTDAFSEDNSLQQNVEQQEKSEAFELPTETQ